jgi:hypothetical protein
MASTGINSAEPMRMGTLPSQRPKASEIGDTIVRKHNPEAPFQYKPKRRMRFSA